MWVCRGVDQGCLTWRVVGLASALLLRCCREEHGFERSLRKEPAPLPILKPQPGIYQRLESRICVQWHPAFCRAMTFTEPGALSQSELQVEGAMTFFGAPCEAGRYGASGMAVLSQRSLSLTHSHSLTRLGFRVCQPVSCDIFCFRVWGLAATPCFQGTRFANVANQHFLDGLVGIC